MVPPRADPTKRASLTSATPGGRTRPNLSVDTTPQFTPTIGNTLNPSPLSSVMRSPEHPMDTESPTAATGMDPDDYPELLLGDITQGPGWPSAADSGMYSAAEAIAAQRTDIIARQLSALTGLAMSQIGGSKAVAKVNKVGDYTSEEAAISKSITSQHQTMINDVMTKFTKELKKKDPGPKGKPTVRAGANMTKQSKEFVKQLIAAADYDVREDLENKLGQLSETAVGIFYKSLVQMLVPNMSGGVKALSTADTTALDLLSQSFNGLIEDQFRSFVNDDRPTPLKADTSKSAGGKQVKLFVKKIKAAFSALDNEEVDEDHPVIAILDSLSDDGLLALWVRLIKSGAAVTTDSPTKAGKATSKPSSSKTGPAKGGSTKTAQTKKQTTTKAGSKRAAREEDDDDDDDEARPRKSARGRRTIADNDDDDEDL